jgi:glutamine amidotransferase
MIAIVDYKMGNLQSVRNAFNLFTDKVKIEDVPDNLKRYDKVLLPGVGAYKDAMAHLKENGMDEAIKEFANSGKPLLGICLGMQLLLESSTEFGKTKGLGLIKGKVIKFDKTKFNSPHKVPHMGWNRVFVKQKNPILKDLPNDFYLYFVHSYHAKTEDRYTLTTTEYGYEFASSIFKDNIVGFQPHPEKSHENGLKIIKNFVEMK